ncbi:MAG: phosphoethanolamine transferase [Prevotella sp.]|uniref:phosphoethanolamine transferase n=1 Tax=Prevotella sp. AGR2160 TaxID=1280674 RepID=UPI00048C139E|nr:phosphoethanolamine transferase [Prevotella sp. AGR2160]MDD5861194.1 phosphoethanolamine transferase [Prevotella sp.]
MSVIKKIFTIVDKVLVPIKTNPIFFGFMYALGVLCALCTMPGGHGPQIYDNLYLELFFDLYVVCLILTPIPTRVRNIIKGLLYIILYVTALVDVYCFVNFDSTLNPSMLMLVNETDSREVGDFFSSLIDADLVLSNVGWILLLILCHILFRMRHWIFRKLHVDQKVAAIHEHVAYVFRHQLKLIPRCMGSIVLVLVVWSAVASWPNKIALHKLFSGTSIGEVEHTLTEKDHGNLYEPIYRLVFSLYANHLAGQQLTTLLKAAGTVKVDSCDYKSPTIVLIIGESYGRQHSQQYGYFMETTPNQVRMQKQGSLIKFDDVVTCWNLTSYVFKNFLSLHVVGEPGEWCDYPLFPELFRKAGYQVTFLTNQFLPAAKQAVYDFSGGFFLNDPALSKYEFDLRNTKLYQYDEGLLHCYDDFVKQGKIKLGGKKDYNLIIFHLIGQHVAYQDRYPEGRNYFWASSYEDKRPDLSDRQRKILSYYDNACRYNDSIVNQIVRRFRRENAVVIYMPDHGEECYEGNRGFICRNHSAKIDWPLAHYEFEIPFWIYCSPSYRRQHREIFRSIIRARHKKFMTDALPHLLLDLAGIHAKDYHAKYDLISPEYDENRPRILKNSADYDVLRSKK